MPMMNSEARKRAAARELLADPRAEARRLADEWDREADHEDACGNGFAAVILHAHARDLRAALADPDRSDRSDRADQPTQPLSA